MNTAGSPKCGGNGSTLLDEKRHDLIPVYVDRRQSAATRERRTRSVELGRPGDHHYALKSMSTKGPWWVSIKGRADANLLESRMCR